MYQTIVPNSGPKLKLVEAAEKLFAEKGFDVVSVRDITQAAGGNVAAVNYHFGSRDGLVAVVMSRYMTPINEERLARLDELEQTWVGQAVPVRDILDALVQPLVGQIQQSKMSEMMFCKLIGRIFGMHGNLPPDLESQAIVLIGRLKRLLHRSLPALDVEELVWRLHFFIGGMLHALTHREVLERISQGAAGTPDVATTVNRLLRFAVAGLCEGGVAHAAEQAAVRPAPAGMDQHLEPTEAAGPEHSSQLVEPAPFLAPVPSAQPVEPPQREEAGKPEVPAVAADPVQPDEPVKKRSRKSEADSPQVFFNF